MNPELRVPIENCVTYVSSLYYGMVRGVTVVMGDASSTVYCSTLVVRIGCVLLVVAFVVFMRSRPVA
jgi:hypothetical protein